MKIVHITKNINIGIAPSAIILNEDRKYVMSDVEYVQLKNIMPDRVGVAFSFESEYREYRGEDLTNKTLLAFRSGGIGDLMFMTPSLLHLKEKYPSCKIIVCAGVNFIQSLENNPNIDELYSMPFDSELLNKADYHKMFQGLIEDSEQAKSKNAYDLFMEALGIDYSLIPRRKKLPIVNLLESEKLWGAKFMQTLGIDAESFRIGVQIETSTSIRTFPFDKMLSIIRIFLEDGMTVFVFGGNRQVQQSQLIYSTLQEFADSKRLVLLPMAGLSLRQSIITASMMNMFVSPDSAFIHIAGAFEIPQIGLYGPFPSKLRMAHMTNAIGLNSAVPCSPCFKHGHWPCEKGDPSPCFSATPVETILEACDYLIEKTSSRSNMAYGEKSWKIVEAKKALNRFDKWMIGEGIDVGAGYFRYNGLERVDLNPLTSPNMIMDILADDSIDKIGRGKYNYALCSFFLFMVPDEIKERFISDLFSLIKPGGYLLFYEPHRDYMPNVDLDDKYLISVLSGLPNIEVVYADTHGQCKASDFARVDRRTEEYAFSVVVRKIP